MLKNNYRVSSVCSSDNDVDEGDDATQTNDDDDDNDEGDGDVDWLSVLLWNCDEPFDCVPVGTLLIRVNNFANGFCLDLLIDEATEFPPDDIVIGIFNSWAGLFSFITDIFNFCTGKLISNAVLFGGARMYERVISACCNDNSNMIKIYIYIWKKHTKNNDINYDVIIK